MATRLVWRVVAMCAVTFVAVDSLNLQLDIGRVAAKAPTACRNGIVALQAATVTAKTTRSRMCSIAKNAFFKSTMTKLPCSATTLSDLKTAICGRNDDATALRTPDFVTTANSETNSISTLCRPIFRNAIGTVFLLASQSQTCSTMKTAVFRDSITKTGACTTSDYSRIQRVVCGTSERTTKKPGETDDDTERQETDSKAALDRKLQDIADTLSASCRPFVSGNSSRFEDLTEEQACTALGGSSLREFLTANETLCSNTEYDKVKDAVCGASMHTLAFSFALLCMLVHVFAKA